MAQSDHIAHSANVAHLNAAPHSRRPVQVIPCTPPRVPPLPVSLAASAAALEQFGHRGERGDFLRALRRRPVAVTFVEVRP